MSLVPVPCDPEIPTSIPVREETCRPRSHTLDVSATESGTVSSAGVLDSYKLASRSLLAITEVQSSRGSMTSTHSIIRSSGMRMAVLLSIST